MTSDDDDMTSDLYGDGFDEDEFGDVAVRDPLADDDDEEELLGFLAGDYAADGDFTELFGL